MVVVVVRGAVIGAGEVSDSASLRGSVASGSTVAVGRVTFGVLEIGGISTTRRSAPGVVLGSPAIATPAPIASTAVSTATTRFDLTRPEDTALNVATLCARARYQAVPTVDDGCSSMSTRGVGGTAEAPDV